MARPRSARVALVLLAAAAVSSCLRVTYRRSFVDEPPARGAVDVLAVGVDGLEPTLAALGAPTSVWGLGPDGGEGLALVYAWSDRRGWSTNLSTPLADYVSASFEFQSQALTLEALVLFFDATWTLTGWRVGALAELLPGNAAEIALHD